MSWRFILFRLLYKGGWSRAEPNPTRTVWHHRPVCCYPLNKASWFVRDLYDETHGSWPYSVEYLVGYVMRCNVRISYLQLTSTTTYVWMYVCIIHHIKTLLWRPRKKWARKKQNRQDSFTTFRHVTWHSKSRFRWCYDVRISIELTWPITIRFSHP